MRMGFLENKPGALPHSFASEQDLGLSQFLRNAPDPKAVQQGRMIHTPIVGACTKCGLTGSVDVPFNMNFKTADNLLMGRITKVVCPKCRKETEFRPLTPEELSEDQFFIMRRYYDIFNAEKVAGRPIPEHVKQFVDEYEKRLRFAMAKKGLPQMPAPVGAEEPAAPAPRPTLIIPE